MDIDLRDAETADLPAVGRIHTRSRANAYAHLLSADALERTTADQMTAYWTERWTWEREICRLTLATRAGNPVGFTYVGPSETPDAVELYAIHAAPEAQGTGVGRAMMLDALTKLAAIDPTADQAVLWVLAGNTHARHFYEKGGWTPDGTTREAPVNGELVPQLRYTHPL